jgi:hypothetical protein
MAMMRMSELPNVTFTTSESILFELLKSADHPQFKAISGLVKEHNQLAMFSS